MKTPREILLGRHAGAEPKLGEIRQRVVAQMGAAASRPRSAEREAAPFLFKLWVELILPAKRIWLGLAAVWIVILVVNLSGSGEEPMVLAKAKTPDAQTVVELKRQKQLMAQLLGFGEMPSDADRPKTFAPRPRSETCFEQMIG